MTDGYGTRVGDTGSPVDDGGGGELPRPRLGELTGAVTSCCLAAVRWRICRCSGVSAMLCRVTSQ